jgi:hypothetical protein
MFRARLRAPEGCARSKPHIDDLEQLNDVALPDHTNFDR